MPGCAAINCSNSVTKGFLMKHFPKDKVRRKLWLVKMKRDNWSPTNYSCLCEIHFGEDMWEKTREDGSRRLKNDAVPTIFSFTKEKTKRKPPTYRQVTSIINNQVSKPQEKLKTSYQQTRDNDDVSLDNNLESNNSENQNKMKYESMLKKMLEYEKEYKYISKGNYNEDDRTFLSGFLDTLEDSNPKNKKIENIQLPQEINEPNMNLCNGELNSFYNVCGYILFSIKKKTTTCEYCLISVGSSNSINASFSKLTKLKRFKKGCLFFCNELTFNFFLAMENIFRKYYNIIKNQNCDIKQFLINKVKEIEISHIPNCHKLQMHIISRFILFRLKIAGRKNTKLLNKYGSKSIACHA